jgi:hypothetical protein
VRGWLTEAALSVWRYPKLRLRTIIRRDSRGHRPHCHYRAALALWTSRGRDAADHPLWLKVSTPIPPAP